ncbi:MAG: hypothetical protein PVH42_05620 [Desulfobacterales bacterium]|jgi:hypothetical protein
MRTIECIRFRSCQPIGQTLAKQLLENFYQNARSQGLLMTVWLDKELSGDLNVHLEQSSSHATNQQYSLLGLSIEQMLEHHGLVSRRLLVSATEKANDKMYGTE